MKIAIVAPHWGTETTSDALYLTALARSLAGRHTVRILAPPERPGPLSPISNPGRQVSPAGRGASHSGAHAARPAGPASDLIVGPALRRDDPEEELPTPALERRTTPRGALPGSPKSSPAAGSAPYASTAPRANTAPHLNAAPTADSAPRARPRTSVRLPARANPTLPADPSAVASGLTVERATTHALDRLPRWLTTAALGHPLVTWALGPQLASLIDWADAVLVPGGEADLLVLAAARLARARGRSLALLPRLADTAAPPAPVDPSLARSATLLTATRAGARALIASGWPADRFALTGPIPAASGPTDVEGFRRRYRIPGPFVLCSGQYADSSSELLRNAIGLVWHKRPEATFVFVSSARSERRTTRTSHAGHLLQLSGLDELEHASAAAAAALVAVPGALCAAGVAIADAWSHARPVIASESPAARELLGDGAAGHVTPPDAHELAAAILRLLTDPAQADRLGAEGARRLREHRVDQRLEALLTDRAPADARPDAPTGRPRFTQDLPGTWAPPTAHTLLPEVPAR